MVAVAMHHLRTGNVAGSLALMVAPLTRNLVQFTDCDVGHVAADAAGATGLDDHLLPARIRP